MKTWWVLGYYHYYPSVDNYIASFDSQGAANEYVAKYTGYDENGLHLGTYDAYDVIDVSDRL